ncbi:Organic hydroperoxide resistance protein [Pontibacillus halophilus JSM 076056 = DSM 19796]|uniref:Organic hydroperoxide resistance protein n=1 Tax=Pontibacillus halophilus JSM 076056 = DSM 19796 TaxID=1385510 RepID=A0A0A5GRT2_9BACI|nr:organic hydroperoxide resistance protein [Pontibacillus halophilus]KGX93875.1 Organic hydroperoxide resistance protein [Pontibacillus halophilus JSM 076056 = DSM 19796]
MKTLYTAQATAQGGRDGNVKSSDGKVDHNLNTPEELGGQGGNGTNPEQLFAAGYSACFDGALNLVASQANEDIESSVTADVHIGKTSEGLGLGATLTVEIKGVDQSRAEELVQKAHETCPYSKATRGNMDVELVTKAV